MAASDNAWNRVMAYARSVAEDSPHLGYGEIGDELLDCHAPGFARCYAVWWSDADVSNGGFSQYFGNSTGGLVLIAIDCFETIGATSMANIFKSALWSFKNQYPNHVGIAIPSDYFDDFTPLSDDLDKLTDMYFAEKYELPGKTKDDCYFTDFVQYYWSTYPDEFNY